MSTETAPKPRVYVDTTVVSYLTAKRSRDSVTAAQQRITREWWLSADGRYHFVVSNLVIEEAGRGDRSAARARLAALKGVTIIEATPESEALTDQLLASGALPTAAGNDAAHVAMAVTNGVDYLVTWNLRHIAGDSVRDATERACRLAGYHPTTVCTPERLLETNP